MSEEQSNERESDITHDSLRSIDLPPDPRYYSVMTQGDLEERFTSFWIPIYDTQKNGELIFEPKLLMRRHQMANNHRNFALFLVGLLLPLVCVAAIAISFGRKINEAWNPVTDSSRYGELLQQMQSSGYSLHFPVSIPANSPMHFDPGPLQAPTVLQVLVPLVQKDLAQLLKNIDASVKPSEINQSRRPALHLESVQSRYTPHSYEIPQSFEVHFLRSATSDKSETNWNHGIQEGIAVDTTKGEVIYFTDVW